MFKQLYHCNSRNATTIYNADTNKSFHHFLELNFSLATLFTTQQTDSNGRSVGLAISNKRKKRADRKSQRERIGWVDTRTVSPQRHCRLHSHYPNLCIKIDKELANRVELYAICIRRKSYKIVSKNGRCNQFKEMRRSTAK